MSSRTNARLAKKKGVAGMGQMHGNGKDSTYFEHEKPEQEGTHQSPQKRQRSTKKPTGGVIRKKVRGKQGRLADLVNMPVDIFTEVASYLLPSDIISLARSNKFFRNMLMRRSAIHIWHGAMKNVTGLPACPPGMSEPHYLALLFSKTYSMCGDPVRAAMDTVLLVRLCGPCRNIHLMPRRAVPLVIVPQVHFTPKSAPETSYPFNVYALREDVSSLLAEYREKACSNDETALDSWAKERNNIKTARLMQAAVLDDFLLALEQNRKQEIEDIKATRQSEVKRRLAEMGWTEKDMEFCWWSRSYHENRQTWDDLVMQPKPLTDRIWTNIKPKLIIILETNRKVHLDMQRNMRTQNRRDSLSKLFFDLKKDSVLDFKVPNPVPWLSSTIPTISFVYRSPFPDFFHILHWPLVKDLYETDSTVEEMETRFEEKREEIEGLVSEWQNRFQSQLVGQVSDGYTSQGETVRPTIAISNDNPDAFANVSDGLKLLLRADSHFRKATLPDPKQPLSYGTVLSTEGLVGSCSIINPAPSRAAPNLDHIHWYPEAHEAARELLADMGIPDASYPEMAGLGSVFACGRCCETDDRDWEGIVQHYVEQKLLCTKVQEDLARSDSRITYANIHDPTLLVDQPLVVDHAVKILESIFKAEIGELQVCRVCERIPVAGQFIALESDILKHLSDVHGIAGPKVDEHYSPKAIGSGFSGKGNYNSGDNHRMFDKGDIGVHVEDDLE